MPAWSHSALNGYETCPRRHYLLRVAKVVKEPESEALRWGNYVHKALENRLKAGTPLPDTLTTYESICSRFEGTGEVTAEREAVLTSKFKPTGWWSKDAWLRSKWDVAIRHRPGVMSIWDWKTGKRKPDSDQMRLSAAVGFLVEPTVQVITTGFVWLKDNAIDKEVFHRPKAKEIWAEFLPRVKRFEIAHEQNKWPARPSGLCRRHCPVGRANCEHCGT